MQKLVRALAFGVTLATCATGMTALTVTSAEASHPPGQRADWVCYYGKTKVKEEELKKYPLLAYDVCVDIVKKPSHKKLQA
jgi:hypothetical protein